MKKFLLKTALLLAALITGSGSVWAEDSYEELFSISSSSVVTNSGYQAYTTTVEGRDYVITFGGNNNSVGTNSNKRTGCTLSNYSKYAVSPVTTSTIASAFACTTSLENVSKIKYSFSGGSNQTNTKVYLLYSSDNNTFSQVSLTSGTQGATITTDTEFTFEEKTGYFALLFEATNSTGNWRIDNVSVTFYKNGDTRTAVNLTSFTASTTTLNVGGTATTTVTNDQTGWTAAYTYASSDETVATVDANGVITAKAEGTATITAALNVNSEDESFKAGAVTSKFIEIEVTAATLYDAAFKVNGANYASDSKAAGAAITFPADPASIGGLSFVGWVKEGDEVTAANVVSAADMEEGGVTYLAVFANGSSVVDNVTFSTTGVEAKTTYADWSGKSVNSSAVYAGKSAGDASTIQLRTSDNNSGVITTTSGGKAKNVSITWNSKTSAGRELTIYGSNTAYTAASDLYDNSKQGTELGTISYNDNKPLVIGGDYAYIGIRSKSGALYLDEIDITWVNIDESTLTTAIAPVEATIGETGFATFSSTKALDFTEVSELYAYIATESGDRINFTRVKKVPAGTGLLLRSADGKAASASVPALVGDDTDATTGNVLVAASEDIASLASTADGKSNYILNQVDGVVGFFQANNQQVAAGKAYIQVAAGSGVKSFSLDFDGEETAVSSVKAENGNAPVYNLAGQRVQKAQKGVFIQNGRKFVVK